MITTHNDKDEKDENSTNAFRDCQDEELLAVICFWPLNSPDLNSTTTCGASLKESRHPKVTFL